MLWEINKAFFADPKDVEYFSINKKDGLYRINCKLKNCESIVIYERPLSNSSEIYEQIVKYKDLVNKLNNLEKLWKRKPTY